MILTWFCLANYTGLAIQVKLISPPKSHGLSHSFLWQGGLKQCIYHVTVELDNLTVDCPAGLGVSLAFDFHDFNSYCRSCYDPKLCSPSKYRYLLCFMKSWTNIPKNTTGYLTLLVQSKQAGYNKFKIDLLSFKERTTLFSSSSSSLKINWGLLKFQQHQIKIKHLL